MGRVTIVRVNRAVPPKPGNEFEFRVACGAFGRRFARSMRGWFVSGTVLAVLFGGAACSTDEPSPVGADKVCDGLFSGRMEKTVESVIGATSFLRPVSNSGMERISDDLKKAYERGRSWSVGAELCWIRPSGDGPSDSVSLDFSMYAPDDLDGPGKSSRGLYYAVGKHSVAGPADAALYFECTSPRFKGSVKYPLRIVGRFGQLKKHVRNTPEALGDNLSIIHAASLAVAKNLECKNDGGLPKRPNLTPIR